MVEQENLEICREMFQILKEISTLLDTGLDDQTLTYCVRLCAKGVNPEALAQIIVSMQNYTNEQDKSVI